VRLLDPETREAWKVKLGSSSSYPTYAQFQEFLVGRTRALENLDLHTSIPKASKEYNAGFAGKSRNKIAAHVATSSNSNSTSTCPLCGSSHYLAKCDRYLSKTLQQRRNIIAKQHRCFNCLGSHAASRCNSIKRCLKCGKKHHTTIHDAHSTPSTKTSENVQSKTDTTKPEGQPQTLTI